MKTSKSEYEKWIDNKTRLKLVFIVSELYLEKERREGLFLEISDFSIGALEYLIT